MVQLSKILVVCDRHGLRDDLVDHAIDLARRHAAAVTVVDVVDAKHENPTSRRTRLAGIAAQFGNAGLNVREQVLRGTPFEEIIRKVVRDGHDMVLKSSAGDGDGAVYAGTDMQLLRQCPCPVWLISTDRPARARRILAAVDPDPGDAQRDALNRQVMDLATSLADAGAGTLHIVNAWRLEEEATLRRSGLTRIAPEDVDKLVEDERQRSAGALDALLQHYPAGDAARTVHLIKGTAAETVPAFATREDIDLIVMGTVGRTGIRGALMGNTAETILGRIGCSVLAVKPPGFVTPVRLAA